ncbi:BTAD domain-containing putative transcriptional regulator [Actinoplanes sp. NPDC024001]|uniref:AfsR/SARP family transcriptional regulator n=1 Tax=Actinoplanes sp. NPDC024001 TaxID=3154598 RepID=UPI0034007AD9
MPLVVRLLGPLELEFDSRPVPISAAKERVIVTVLALSPGRVVSTTDLVAALWADDPPESAGVSVRVLVSRLRKTLAAAGCGTVIVTRPPGYLLVADEVDVDHDRFRALAADGRERLAAGAPAEAAAALSAALALWRGPRLAESDDGRLAGEAVRLAEDRMTTTESWVDAELACGRHAGLIGELDRLCRESPLRESLWGRRMLALYRCGRQADALAVYQELRSALADELGLDPSAELRRLESAILTQDPAVAAPATARAHRRDHPLPRQLPAPPRPFSGRERELARLDDFLAAADAGGPAVGVVSGTAGVGKTALLLHWAHRVAGRFDGGQLHIDLRGYGPAGSPVGPEAALRGFLTALGMAPDAVPAGFEAQLGLYRSLAADRRLLVVIDNARDAGQVRPLIPGTPGCLTVITSRDRLSGLVADGAYPLTLDLPTAAEAFEMLAHRVGRERAAADPAGMNEIITLCARLPLALAVVGARAATYPTFALSVLAGELGKARSRLDELSDEDAATDARVAFSWSYGQLTPPAARLFRLLGLHPGPDIGRSAAARLAGVPVPAARSLLRELAHAHLVWQRTPGRFSFHDLLRAYARELTETHETRAERAAARRRLLHHYIERVDHADALLSPYHEDAAARPSRPQATDLPDDRAQALGWLNTEFPVLLAVVGQTTGFDRQVWQIAAGLTHFFSGQGHLHDAVDVLGAAVAAARRMGDPARQAFAHRYLGCAFVRLGRYADAQVHLQQALRLFQDTGDRTGQAHVHRHHAWMLDRQARHREALPHAERALAIYRDTGHRAGQARALNAIGWFHAVLGDHPGALDHCRQALDLQREIGDRFGEAETLDSLGFIHHHLGRHADAVACYRDAVRLYREFEDSYSEAEVLAALGDAHRDAGEAEAAREAWQRSVRILDRLGHPDAEKVRAKLTDTRLASPGPLPSS